LNTPKAQRGFGVHDRLQRAAFQVLHHQVEQTVDPVLSEVQERDDVRVRKAACRAGLPHESQHHVLVVDEVRVKHLDRDPAVKGSVLAAVDAAHGAAAEEVLDDVLVGDTPSDEGIGPVEGLGLATAGGAKVYTHGDLGAALAAVMVRAPHGTKKYT
jgi:hypothetical protein